MKLVTIGAPIRSWLDSLLARKEDIAHTPEARMTRSVRVALDLSRLAALHPIDHRELCFPFDVTLAVGFFTGAYVSPQPGSNGLLVHSLGAGADVGAGLYSYGIAPIRIFEDGTVTGFTNIALNVLRRDLFGPAYANKALLRQFRFTGGMPDGVQTAAELFQSFPHPYYVAPGNVFFVWLRTTDLNLEGSIIFEEIP